MANLCPKIVLLMLNSFIYNRLYEWYESNRRILPWRETEDGYKIWLSEVILQQTRVAQGMEYYLRFVSRWPKVENLAAADEAEVLREWQGLGYYSRARNLHKAAQMVVERGWSPFPTRFEDLRSLPGVGEYTAGAIASFAYNRPYPAMDGNVYRVVARLLDIDEPFDTTAGKKLFHKEIELLMDREHPRLFNSAIMEFGALYCTPSNVRRSDVRGTKEEESGGFLETKCPACPLNAMCLSYAHGTAELLPVRKARPKVRDRWLEYHIYVQRDNVQSTEGEKVYTLIRRRENPKDIWYHLYEFPCEEQENAQRDDVQSNVQRDNVQGTKEVCSFTHVLSHQRIHARFIIQKVEELPTLPDTFRVSWPELDEYALSRLTLRALDLISP